MTNPESEENVEDDITDQTEPKDYLMNHENEEYIQPNRRLNVGIQHTPLIRVPFDSKEVSCPIICYYLLVQK